MNFGAEHAPQTCPLHFGVPIPEGLDGSCFICRMAGLEVTVCDPSTARAFIDALEQTGSEYVPAKSRAVLVFRRPGAIAAEPDRKPLARVQPTPPIRRSANGRA